MYHKRLDTMYGAFSFRTGNSECGIKPEIGIPSAIHI
jgi:hypothetical protein